ncbi:MAG TPA: alpha/beta fold hydrolase [Acidimicrobiia bacterium]|nr:alpha/beta fold hydrolase [Acidimicrobiia bacterium]
MPDLVASDGVDIHYEVFGRADGEPLLMIQGLGTDSRGWAFQRLAFGRRFRCYAIDNRGVGRSGRPPGPYSLFQMADDAVRILDAEGVEAAHVIGASMGGAIAQIIGVLYAERTRSLVLACTACRHHPWRRELLADWAAAVQEKGMAALGDDGLQWLIGPRLRRRFGLWLNLLARILLQSPPEPFVAQVDAILDMSDELRFELSGVTVPTLVITGSQDALTPVGDAEELAELIPHARLVIIPRAAHGLMVETPNAFNAAVLEFFADITGDATVADDAADQAASA